MPVDFAASQPHYAAHLFPIWQALDDHERGRWFGARRSSAWLQARGVERIDEIASLKHGTDPVATAGYEDFARAGARPVILLEHGAGQDYGDRHPSNPGGHERECVVLFLCPNESVARRNLDRYPGADAAVVGCPKLDRWHSLVGGGARLEGERIGVSFHWDNRQCPEAGWAFPFYRAQLSALANRYYLIGHGHPRAWGRLLPFWRSLGCEYTDDFEVILERCDLYVCDNSSTLYEFASLDRPVLVLNSPRYRRDVTHGLRFWRSIPGLQCDTADDLVPAVGRALEDPPEAREIRGRAVADAYAACDGQAATRAAEAIRKVAGC